MRIQHRASIKENFTCCHNKSCALFSQNGMFTGIPPRNVSMQLCSWKDICLPEKRPWGVQCVKGLNPQNSGEYFSLAKKQRCTLVALTWKLSRYWSKPSWETSLSSPGDYEGFFWWSSDCVQNKLPLCEVEIRELPWFQKAVKTRHRFIPEIKERQAWREELSPLISCVHLMHFIPIWLESCR